MIKAKKHLGQNFLNSPKIAQKIAQIPNISNDETVLEIGPGTGILTEQLLKTHPNVLAIEKDKELIPILEEKFQKQIASKQFQLLHRDILDWEPEFNQKYHIVANIPYYITGALLKKFLTVKNQPNSITFLIQKEVAERIMAKNKKESILSISIKVYGTPHIVMRVPARFFTPMPKVDSAVIYITDISRKNFEKLNEISFFKILKTGFKNKRKKLSSNLAGFDKKENIEKILLALGKTTSVRAEELSVEDWLHISQKLSEKNQAWS